MKLREINSSSFETEVNADGLVVVKMTADWCRPCNAWEPVLEKAAEETSGKCSWVKLNIDNAPELVSEYEVKTIPTLILFNNGEEINRMVGTHNYSEIMGMLGFDTKSIGNIIQTGESISNTE